ncbi:thioredoxin-disulfide reductase [Ichthyobacterium seriolicida]|uniref:Thioredoxin reductase n=1 Tax=Ichthyobacterium seriolicida TaxID=242600 RepID=A0A1J1E473_9FLAO|nr:thioredoxin reductase [Ichthyobacterium seriolicida]
MEVVKCLIIGSGPAGYTAAIYASRADLKPVMYTGLEVGGQLINTTDVDNFPGYPDGVKGRDMMEDLKNQAGRFGTVFRFKNVVDIIPSLEEGGLHKVVIEDGTELSAKTVIISTGATAKSLGIPSETRLKGYGVSACAICDGFFYRGQSVAVVGGGDTAAEEASYLSNICSKVTLLVRGTEMRASKAMQNRVLDKENIEVLFNTQVQEVLGDSEVTGVSIINSNTGDIRELSISGLFVAIGHKPNTDIFRGKLDMDEMGYIITKPDSTKTNLPGVFAAGDVQDKHYRQAVTAAATGCMAALDAERYIQNSN